MVHPPALATASPLLSRAASGTSLWCEDGSDDARAPRARSCHTSRPGALAGPALPSPWGVCPPCEVVPRVLLVVVLGMGPQWCWGWAPSTYRGSGRGSAETHCRVQR